MYFLNENYKKINKDQLDELLNEFFLSLGDDVYNLYVKLCDNSNICISSESDFLAYSLDTKGVDNSCIVISDCENNMAFYFSLVHEMGHCYQNYL